MPRPAFYISTAVLAAAAVMPFLDARSAPEQATPRAEALHLPAARLATPAQTISSREISRSASPQRWVF